MNKNKLTKLAVAGSLSLSLMVPAFTAGSVSAQSLTYANALVYPQNFKAGVSPDTVSLTWGKVTGATSYVLEKNGVKIYEGAAYSFKDVKLAPSTTYNYTLYAKNATSASSKVSLSATTLKALSVPTAPSTVKVVPTSNSAKISWTKSEHATHYIVKRNGVTVYIGVARALSYTNKNLKSSTAYTYTVTAKNSSGSAESAPVSVKTPAVKRIKAVKVVKPAKPTKVKAVKTTNSVKLTWAASKGATSYVVFKNKVLVYSGTNLSFVDNAVKAGESIKYQVVAVNNLSKSTPTQITVKIPAVKTVKVVKPAKPSKVKVESTTNSVKLTWAASKGATSYQVFKKNKLVYTGTNLSFLDKEAKAGESIFYKIYAVNQTAKSAPAQITVKVKQEILPAKVAGLKAKAFYKSALISWKKTKNATSYEVLRNGVKVYEGKNLKFADTTLAYETSYTYTVIAKNKYGNSEASVIKVTTLLEKNHLIEKIDASYKGSSIVDYLNAAKYNSSFSSRAALALKLGIKNYQGSNSQNLEMLKMLRSDGK